MYVIWYRDTEGEDRIFTTDVPSQTLAERIVKSLKEKFHLETVWAEKD